MSRAGRPEFGKWLQVRIDQDCEVLHIQESPKQWPNNGDNMNKQLILALYFTTEGTFELKWYKPAYEGFKSKGLLLNVAQVLHDHADALERLEDGPSLGPILVQ